MSEVTALTDEKARLNVHVGAGVKEKLVALAGSERAQGEFLSRLINAIADDERVAPVESALLDVRSVRQVADNLPVGHNEALPSVAMRNKGFGGQIAFAVDLWHNGRPTVLAFGYDKALGWTANAGYHSTVSQALTQLGGDGWAVVGQHGNSILLQRRVPVAQSLN